MKGRKIGPYELEKIIGQGSFGKVYLGTCGNQNYALKCISKKTRTNQEIRNLKSETNLLMKIKHKNIIMLKECLETEGELVVVMEYAGADLSELLKKTHKLSDDRIRLYGRQILNAMLYLNQNRILHRDLKPQNILLQKDEIKLCDFGFAKQMSASTNFLRSIKGTPLYIAPEILLSRPYTSKVDVWSFGVILYQLATGHTPFYASTIQKLQPKILHQPIKFPSQMNPALRELIDGMLQKSEMKRFDWQQVKNHRFFTDYPDIVPEPLQIVSVPSKEPEKQVKWDIEEECAYLSKLDSEFQEGRVVIKDLRYNQDFCLRVTQFFGQACLSRQKIPQDILLKMIKLVTKLSMQKSEVADIDKDLAKNKNLMAAIISLGLEEIVEQFLQAELELIGFLLKQNFDGIKIDTDHDSEITNLISRRLAKKQPGTATVLCLKVLGILTSQAIMTLGQSEEYFERVAEEKLVTQVAECYFQITETHTVLECLQKFIHPRIQRVGYLSHKTKLVFHQLKEEAASVLMSKGFIRQEPLSKRKWNRSTELQHYCEILFECLKVSDEMRSEFLKYTYWQQLLSNKKTRLYFLGYAYLVLKHNGKVILSNEMLQNESVESSQNKLANVFLLYLAYHKLKNHPMSKTKIQKIKILFNNIQDRLTMDQDIKKKHCYQFVGSLSEDGQLFDDILISIISSVAIENKHEEVIAKLKSLIDDALLLPLSEDSLLTLLSIIRSNGLKIEETQTKKLTEYLTDSIKKEAFDDFLAIWPQKCGILIKQLMTLQIQRMTDDKEISNFAEIVEKHQFLRLLFSQQLTGKEMILTALRTVNRIIYRIKSPDFLVHTALGQVKKYYNSENEELMLEIILFCSSIARINAEASKQVLQSGVISLCLTGLNEGSELIKQKTLHLIGNLSKYNKAPFEYFEKYGILKAISKCLAAHKQNLKILKNTVYAIGNICYYSDRFASEIKYMIKNIAEGLTPADEHLLLNTLSTISNLLRHGDTHLPTLIETGTLSKVVELYSKASNADQVNYFNNLMKKAVAFSEFQKHFDKKRLKQILECHIASGLVRPQNENVRKLKQLFS